MSAATAQGEMVVQMPEYASVFFDTARYKVLYGGRGGAKSWTAARALLIQGHERTHRILCTREHQVSIRDSVHRLLADQIEVLGLGNAYVVKQAEIRHRHNGTVFIFEGLRHNIDNVKSTEGITRCWCEEAERISDNSWRVLIPTIRAAGSEVWVTFNPDQEDDPTYKRFVLTPPANAIVRKVGWEDNPWFPDELYAEMEHDYAVDPISASHVWGGECRSATDAQVLKGKWVVREFEPEDDWDGPYHGADWGFASDPTVLVRSWVHDDCLYVEREAYRVGLEIDDTAEFFEREVPDCSSYIIRGDNARPETISYLKRNGLPKLEGVKKWPGSVQDGIQHLRSYRQIVIHPRCKHTVQEARLYSYKVDQRTGDVLPELVDTWNHCIDALRYSTVPMYKLNAQFSFRVI